MSLGRKFVLSDFSKHVGEKFELHAESDDVRTVELIEAEAGTIGVGEDRTDGDTGNFALLFKDAEASVQSYLPQKLYEFQHETIGTFSLFIVPIGPDKDGTGICYEAVFTSLG